MDSILKFIENVINLVSYLLIVASPTILGGFIGFVIVFYNQNNVGLTIAIFLTVLGFIVGIFWANRIRKKHGTSEFLSRINSSPDIDEINKQKK